MISDNSSTISRSLSIDYKDGVLSSPAVVVCPVVDPIDAISLSFREFAAKSSFYI